MKKFNTVNQADEYLNNIAASKGLIHYNIEEGTDRRGNDIMILIEEDSEQCPLKTIETVIFSNW